MVWLVWISARYIWIKQCLDSGALHAAKLLGQDYANEPQSQTSPPTGLLNSDPNVQKWYSEVRIAQVIANNAQFNATYTVGTNVQTPSVTVSVTYMAGSYGLPTLPGFDLAPIHAFKTLANPSSSSTWRLEGQPSN
jgi:hypothetical protein